MKHALRTLVICGLLFSSAIASTPIIVWANTHSGIYHCLGSVLYGKQNKVNDYRAIPLDDAHKAGYTPSRGHECTK